MQPKDLSRRRSLYSDPDCLAELVMRVYTMERRLFDAKLGRAPSYTPSARDRNPSRGSFETQRRRSQWHQIAAFLIDKRIEPIDYIARQFDRWERFDRPIFPSDLLTPAAWTRYQESKASKAKSVRSEFRWQTDHFHQMIFSAADLLPKSSTMEQKWLYALCWNSVGNNLSPIFVFFVASRQAEEGGACAERFRHVAEQLQETAAVEFIRFRREYEAVWGKLVPKHFRGYAQSKYRAVLRHLF